MKRISFFSVWVCLAALGSTWLAPSQVRAQALPISTLTLVPDEKYLHLELTLNPFELTFFSKLDANRDGRLDPREWTGQGEKIARRILERLQLSVNGRPVVADIAGLTQSYESPRIIVRAHFAVAARKARITVESQLAAVTSGSHITQVTLDAGDRVQAARLNAQSPKVTFDAVGPVDSSAESAAVPGGAFLSQARGSWSAFAANETAVSVLLGLLLVASLPPIVFCLLVGRRSLAHEQVVAAPNSLARAANH